MYVTSINIGLVKKILLPLLKLHHLESSFILPVLEKRQTFNPSAIGLKEELTIKRRQRWNWSISRTQGGRLL